MNVDKRKYKFWFSFASLGVVFAVLLVRYYRIEIDIDDSIRWRLPRSVKLLNQQEFAYRVGDLSGSFSITIRIFRLSHFFVSCFVVD